MGQLCGSPLLFFDPTLQVHTSDGSFYTQFESVGRELNALANQIDSLFVCGQSYNAPPSSSSYELSDQISVIELPYWSEQGDKSGFLKGIHRNAIQVYRKVRQFKDGVVLLRSGPHPATIIAWLACKDLNSTTVYFIGSDFKQNTFFNTEHAGTLRRLSERAFAILVDNVTHRVSRVADATFVHPGHLESKYADANRLYTTIISTIYADEVSEGPVRQPEDSLSILYVGGLSRPKGVDLLVRSFANASATTDKDITLTIRGTGGDEERIRRLAASEGVADDIKFLSYLPYDELLELYRKSDIFVLPSRQEGQGRVLVEALASGCAVLASDVGGIPHIVTDRENGLLVEPGNKDALTQGLTELIEDPSLRRRLAQCGLDWARENTLEARTDDLIEKIRTVHEWQSQ